MNWIVDRITDHSRAVVAFLLVVSVVLGAGVGAVERSAGVGQFQSDTAESDALEYVDSTFSSGGANTTTAQVIVTDENVLDRATLLSMLEYQQALGDDASINGTLAGTDATASVANVVATVSITEHRAADLRARQAELNATSAALEDALETLASQPNASVRSAFDSVAADSSVALTEADYRVFEAAARQLRGATDETAVEAAYRNGTRGVLVEEYEALSADRAALHDGIDPSLATQHGHLASLNDSQVADTVQQVLTANGSGRALQFVPNYYEPGSTSTNATLLVVTQQTDGGSFAPGDAPADIEDAQQAMAVLGPEDDQISTVVYGAGIVSTEISDSMTDSIVIVGPLAGLFVLLVLVVVYRDVLDILLGLAGILAVLVWTFGLMGWLGIDFSQPFIVVVVLLIGLSIDYSIHVVMRYREARAERDSPRRAMAAALGSVGVALLYVTATTVVGFLSNLASPLSVFRQIGLVAALGILSALVVFGVFVPAIKLELDALLSSVGVDRRAHPFGSNGSRVSRLLAVGADLATAAPYVVIVVAVLLSGVGLYGATQVDTSFSQSDFLAEDPPQWQRDLPEPFAPGSYRANSAMDTLDADFVRQDTSASVLIRGEITDPGAFDRLDAARTNASQLGVTEVDASGQAVVSDPLSVMTQVAADNETLATTLAAADTDGDGTPDRNVSGVYDALFDTAPEEAATVLARSDDGDYRAMRLVITVAGDASGEAVREQVGGVAADLDGDGLDATETGDVIVNQITANQLTETVFTSLAVSLLAVFVLLSLLYRLTEGSASLGAVTVVPVAFTLTWVLGSMALLDIPFNIVTGLITSLTIGLGVDYSLHLSERFNQELEANGSIPEAIHESVVGTGGALLSSAATTAAGFGVLLVAILPFLRSFGLITALTIVFALLASVLVLPSLLVVWARLVGHGAAGDTEGDRSDAGPDQRQRPLG